MAQLICEVCGEEFIAYGRQAKIRKRCSTACYAIHLRRTRSHEFGNTYNYNPNLPIVPCEICGRFIRLDKGKAQINQKHHFCSRKCYYMFRSKEYRGNNHPNWRGGISYYRGRSWQHLRDKVRERDNYTCQDCRRHEGEFKEHLHAHHIIPYDCFNSLKHANNLSNLVALCRSCHIKRDMKLKQLPRFIPLPLVAENPSQNLIRKYPHLDLKILR